MQPSIFNFLIFGWLFGAPGCQALELSNVYALRQLGSRSELSSVLVGKRRDRRQLELQHANDLRALESLKKQHAELDSQLLKVSSDAEKKQIKLEKLSLKDRISKLVISSSTSTPVAPSSTALLGEGASGKVFLGTCVQTAQIVAVKTVSPSSQQGLLKEYFVLQRLSSEPVGFTRPHYYGSQSINGVSVFALVMDMLGPSAEALLFSTTLGTGGFSPFTTLHIARDVLLRLEALSRQNLVHGDLHLGNLLLGANAASNKTVHLIDFGRTTVYPQLPRGAFRGVFDSRSDESWLPSLPFASADVLAGRTPRPKDDLESLLFSLACLSAGACPDWGQARADAVSGKRNYAISDLLTCNGQSSPHPLVESVLLRIQAQIRADSTAIDFHSLIACVDQARAELPPQQLLDWELAGIHWTSTDGALINDKYQAEGDKI